MNRGAQPVEPFARLIAALEPWLDQIVIVGGWAHRLYRLHPDAMPLDYPPLFTLDADIALSAQVTAREQDIRARLMAFDFKEDFAGEGRPPAAHYRLGGDESGFYAEFLTPLIGAEHDRKHRRKTTVEVAGASAQQLRHIELLLHRPWSIDLAHDRFAPSVRIANPIAFLVQKLLIHRKREPSDRAKDILYMRDTLEIFGGQLSELASLWRNDVRVELAPGQIKVVVNAAQTIFGDISDDLLRAAEISPERAPDPEEIRKVCRYGFSELFGA